MSLALNDIVAVSFRGTLFGQRIINTLHYAVAVAATGTTEDNLKLITTDIQAGTGSIAGLKAHFLDCIAIQYTLDVIRAQRVYPARTVFQETVSGDVGQYSPSDCKNPNVSISVWKRSLTPGRMGVGRLQLAGLGYDAFLDGEVDPGTVGTFINTFAADVKTNYTTSAPVITLTPVLYNPTGAFPKFSIITSTGFETTARTMHRRTLRVGE